MSKDKLPDEIQEYLEALLSAGIQVADLQYDETSRLGMLTIVETLAEYFGCELTVLTAEITEDGEVVVSTDANVATEDLPDDEDPDNKTVH